MKKTTYLNLENNKVKRSTLVNTHKYISTKIEQVVQIFYIEETKQEELVNL